jgi:hypothetical protein
VPLRAGRQFRRRGRFQPGGNTIFIALQRPAGHGFTATPRTSRARAANRTGSTGPRVREQVRGHPNSVVVALVAFLDSAVRPASCGDPHFDRAVNVAININTLCRRAIEASETIRIFDQAIVAPVAVVRVRTVRRTGGRCAGKGIRCDSQIAVPGVLIVLERRVANLESRACGSAGDGASHLIGKH